MKNLKSLTLTEFSELVRSLDWESYRAQQIFTWIWQKGITDINPAPISTGYKSINHRIKIDKNLVENRSGINQMTNLSKQKRELLQQNYFISSLKLIEKKESLDGAQKFLWELEDKNRIESVYIPEADRKTVCVSTQVGCPLQCKICYTGKIGFTRNLKFYEIADQILQIQLLIRERITNVVFMGMGEPFLNYDETLKAIETINSDFGLNIGARKITVSTVGIIERIYDFSDFPLQAKLAISLNATSDEIRNKLMPINKKYPLSELIKAIKYYTDKKKKRVTFEYVLIKGINDRPQDVKTLIKLLKGIPCKINLIPFNPFPNTKYISPKLEEIQVFAEKLYPELPAVTIRKSKGSDILAACGQLAGKPN